MAIQASDLVYLKFERYFTQQMKESSTQTAKGENNEHKRRLTTLPLYECELAY